MNKSFLPIFVLKHEWIRKLHLINRTPLPGSKASHDHAAAGIVRKKKSS